MRQLGILILIACLAASSGCNLCCWGKRNAELTGPTDIRKSQAWCLGEDAIFHQPMGPTGPSYGMKQTCWREWQATGPACANGSCGLQPTTAPTVHRPEVAPQLVPPQQLPPASGIDPFRDDVEPLPVPPKTGAKQKKPPQKMRMAATQESAKFQTLFTPATKQAPRIATARPKPTAPKIPPRVVVKRAPAGTPTQIVQQSPAAISGDNSGRLRITVSDAIGTPEPRILAPVMAPGTVVQSSLPAPAQFQQSQETLAGLEQMVDAKPTTTDRNGPAPAIIRNEFAAPVKPFRLSTRTSRPEPERDPELERETLSALGDMFSEKNSTPSGE